MKASMKENSLDEHLAQNFIPNLLEKIDLKEYQ